MKVKELLSSKEKWTQGAYARTADGQDCHHNDERAVAWDLTGAIWRCYTHWETKESGVVFQKVVDKVGDAQGSILSWHDAPERTYEEVKQLVDALDI